MPQVRESGGGGRAAAWAGPERRLTLVTDARLLLRPSHLLPIPLYVCVGGLPQGMVGAEFRHNRLYLGGDVSLGTIAILHRRAALLGAGAVEVSPGVFLGGFNASRALVASAQAPAADFRFLRGYMRWSPEAMAAELADGAWRTVAAAPDVLLPPPVGERVRRAGAPKTPRRGLWETLIASSTPSP